MKRTNIRIAIQKDGRLKQDSLALLDAVGLLISQQNGRTLIVPCQNAAAEILFVRHGDIPQYVQSGAADFGVVGDNVLQEIGAPAQICRSLHFGECRLAIAVPLTSDITQLAQLDGERIATSYPHSLRKFLREQKINASIIEIRGAVEVTPALGLADAICDLIQTGTTLQENQLRPIATLFTSRAVLIESPYVSPQKSAFINKFFATLP